MRIIQLNVAMMTTMIRHECIEKSNTTNRHQTPYNLFLPHGRYGLHLTHDSLSLLHFTRHPKTTAQPFLHGWCQVILYIAPPYAVSSKLTSGPPDSPATTPNGISIESEPVFPKIHGRYQRRGRRTDGRTGRQDDTDLGSGLMLELKRVVNSRLMDHLSFNKSSSPICLL